MSYRRVDDTCGGWVLDRRLQTLLDALTQTTQAPIGPPCDRRPAVASDASPNALQKIHLLVKSVLIEIPRTLTGEQTFEAWVKTNSSKFDTHFEWLLGKTRWHIALSFTWKPSLCSFSARIIIFWYICVPLLAKMTRSSANAMWPVFVFRRKLFPGLLLEFRPSSSIRLNMITNRSGDRGSPWMTHLCSLIAVL